jgi:hypothetical protein
MLLIPDMESRINSFDYFLPFEIITLSLVHDLNVSFFCDRKKFVICFRS